MSAFLQKQLEINTGKKLILKINDNRSTMLSVRWGADCTLVSLHRMFLNAPQNVLESLASYLKRKEKAVPEHVRFFIEDNLPKLNYSSQVDRRKLCSQGSTYDLQKIYRQLNLEYFNDKLDLLITWYGNATRRNKTKVTFGLYHDSLRLIKIHRLLDSPTIPDYIVEYVVYHEMLHFVCRPHRDEKGVHRIHTKAFKQRERQFKHFNLAQQWIKAHHGHLFRGY